MNLAPILVTTYNRYEHLKKTIESIKENILATQSHLFLAIDYPVSYIDKKLNEKIVDYAKNINGFKKVTLIIRKKNLGVELNFNLALDQIFEEYDRFIFFEDDNIFSKDFLLFINEGLNTFENRKDIFSVCGYNYPVKIPESYTEDIYVWKGISTWGFGCWRKKWKQLGWDDLTVNEKVANFLKNTNSIKKLNKVADHYLPALLRMEYERVLSGDTYICMNLVQDDMYSVFPVETKVKNIGHDGSGLHCKIKLDSPLLIQNTSNKNINVNQYENIESNEVIDIILSNYFRKNYIKRIINFILYILYRLKYNYIRGKYYKYLKIYLRIT